MECVNNIFPQILFPFERVITSHPFLWNEWTTLFLSIQFTFHIGIDTQLFSSLKPPTLFLPMDIISSPSHTCENHWHPNAVRINYNNFFIGGPLLPTFGFHHPCPLRKFLDNDVKNSSLHILGSKFLPNQSEFPMGFRH